MRIIKPSFSLDMMNETSPTKKIERIARICYKSEDKICDGSDLKMIANLLKRKHLAMIEHASACFEVDQDTYELLDWITQYIMRDVYQHFETLDEHALTMADKKDAERCYLRFTRLLTNNKVVRENDNSCILEHHVKRYLISGNFRAWYEIMELLDKAQALTTHLCDALVKAGGGPNGILGKYEGCGLVDQIYDYTDTDAFAHQITDFSILTPEERMIHEDLTIHFVVDRGITHELVRMRDCSFAQESTRYCNYAHDKFGGEITFIEPFFWHKDSVKYKIWENIMKIAESSYKCLMEEGATPQEARSILPNSLKAEIVMTTNLREWRHIFSLRACNSTGPSHPQMNEIMQPLLEEVKPMYEFAFGDLSIPNN